MCERPKVHVFLGAPPPSGQVTDRRPAGFNRLELTWQDGHLHPATGGEADGDDLGPDRTTEGSVSDHPIRHLEGEGPSTESVHEYLDSCFPAGQAEHHTGSEARSGVSGLTERTQYLSTWTLSQALVLRGRAGTGSAASPEKASPSQSVSSSTPELFSQPSPTPRAEQGGVVIEATPDGVLCSQEAARAPQDSPGRKKPRMSENVTGESPGSPSGKVAALRCPATPLARCEREGASYTVLVAVVHPCHLKEIKVSGALGIGHHSSQTKNQEKSTFGHQGATSFSVRLFHRRSNLDQRRGHLSLWRLSWSLTSLAWR